MITFIKIEKSYIENLKEHPKLLLLLCYLFLLKNNEDTIVCNINNITEKCGYKITRSISGATEQFKQLLIYLIEQKILIVNNDPISKISIQKNIYKITNTELFNLKFVNQNQFLDIKTNFVSLNYSDINKIIEFVSNSEFKNTNFVNTSTLLNIYTVIKSYIYEHKHRLNYSTISTNSISEILGLSNPTIFKNIKILEDLNLLYVYRFDKYNNIDGNIKKMNNAYSITKYNLDDVKNDIINTKWK